MPRPERKAHTPSMVTTSRSQPPGVGTPSPAGTAGAASSCALLVAMTSQGVSISARHRQRLALEIDGNEAVYLVQSGVLMAHAAMQDERHQVLALYYPGDMIRTSLISPFQGATLTTVSHGGKFSRMHWPALERLAIHDPAIASAIMRQLTDQAARLALRATIIANLTREERVASLLLELATHLGTQTPQGLAFDTPFSRTDAAHYLGLNPDTLSRVVSRFRAEGMLIQLPRSRLVCPDLTALHKACPIWHEIALTHGKRTDAR